ncbi:hypothetical protein QVA66_08150 [Staphylococcus chromogenes]|nr:hypothetical protein [Staphylococcus chromogenes]
MISLRLDLSTATVGELTTLLDAASAAGASADTKLQIENNALRIDISAGARAARQAEESPADPESDDVFEQPQSRSENRYGGLLGPVVSEEFVRGVVDSILYDKNRRPRP